MDDKIIPHLVARFLSWKLPPDFHPDAGISFVPDYNNGTPQGGRHEPTGTNLLNAEQAFAMVRHLLDHPAFSAALSSAIPRAEADDGWRTIESAPSEPGSFVGDIFYGDPTLTTQGTHRWNGSEWERLPSDAELLTKMLAASRAKELPSEMDHEMQMVWQSAWHAQSVIRHKARFKPEQPVSCEAAAWKAVVALVKARGKAAAQAGER